MKPNRPAEADPASRALLRDADACVKCGACLPACPTYASTRHEADSPRGRIGLVQGLVGGGIPPDGALAIHLDGCLRCGLCEAVCPAQVPIVRVIDGGSARLRRAGVGVSWRAVLIRNAARFRWAVRWGAERIAKLAAVPGARRAA